ncbi:MAG: hypothetical protein AVDCRST_MAG49-973, partial [uncultured Thermomicrobiales bacterium]
WPGPAPSSPGSPGLRDDDPPRLGDASGAQRSWASSRPVGEHGRRLGSRRHRPAAGRP